MKPIKPKQPGRHKMPGLMNVVTIDRPVAADEIADYLDEMSARARAGEFRTIYLMAFRPDGRWLTVERGERHNRLETIGILESLKADILASTEADG